MFEKWKEKRIKKKIEQLKRHAVFHVELDKVRFEIGTYRTGRARAFDILMDHHTHEKTDLTNVRITLTDEQALVITGMENQAEMPLTKTFPKEAIKWSGFYHLYHIGLDHRFRLCSNPNGGTLDISLANGDSLLVHYTVDQQKEKQLTVS